jgi:hypothetical protein
VNLAEFVAPAKNIAFRPRNRTAQRSGAVR